MYIVKNNNKKKRIVEKSRQMINLRRKKNVWIFVLYTTLRHIRVRMLYIFLSILFIHFRIWLSMKEKKNDEMEF